MCKKNNLINQIHSKCCKDSEYQIKVEVKLSKFSVIELSLNDSQLGSLTYILFQYGWNKTLEIINKTFRHGYVCFSFFAAIFMR